MTEAPGEGLARDGGGRLRLAAVSYVNAWPLTAGLDCLSDVEFSTAPPSAVAGSLRAGVVDAGLVPSIELLRQPAIEAVGSSAISAFGPVDSVLVLLRRAPGRVATLALDPASRTSQALAVLIFENVFGVRPETFECDPDRAWSDRVADAVLVIGDRALHFRHCGVPYLDLADHWSRWTGLPFVFAVWAAPRDARSHRSRLETILAAAAAAGGGSIGAIASLAASRGPLDAAGFEVYLTRRIRYGLGERERSGLSKFLDLAAASRTLSEG